MRLPRLTYVYTVDIYLKGGAVLRKDFTDFKWKYSGSEITNLNWRSLPGDSFFVAIDQIAAISKISERRRIIFRER